MSMIRQIKRRKTLALMGRTCALALLLGTTASSVSADSHDALHDVYDYFSYMMNVRDEIRSYRAAQDALAAAKADLETARKNLADAQAAQEDSAANLVRVGEALAAAEEHLAATKAALASAEEASAARTQEALAAQQAEDGYASTLDAKRAALESLYRESDALSSAADASSASSAPGTESAADAERAKVVARVLAEVDYGQNRLSDAQRMVDEALAAKSGAAPGSSDSSGASGVDERLAQLSAEIDAAQASLDAAEAYFDTLTAAREEAEDAEREVRELVDDYREELQASEADLVQSWKDREEAEKYVEEARTWALEAAGDVKAAEREVARSERELRYFGEGAGAQAGLEYYTWRGERAGHQLYLPLSYFSRTHRGETKFSYGVSTGYVKSHTGFAGGSVSGLTDTQFSVTIHNEKPVTSVHYGFGLNVPTGQSRLSRYGVVPEGLARFTDFGSGWQLTPSVEIVHRLAERDRLTGRFSYALRGGYDYSKEVPGAHVSPGDVFSQEIEYLHAGEKRLYMVQLYHNSTGSAAQDDVDTDSRTITGRSNYRDGDDWELRFFYHWELSPKNALRFYTIQTLNGAAKGIDSPSVGRQYYGLGLRHRVSDKMTWQVMAHYQRVSTTYDPLRTSLNTGGGFRRVSLIAGLEWRPNERRNLTLQLERYVRSDDGGAGYNGWGSTFWYQNTF